MSRRVEKVAPSVLQVNLSPSLTVCSCIANDNQIALSLVREEKIESRGQSILRKQQILCNKFFAPVQVTLDDESLPDEIKQVVSNGNVESIVYYAKEYGMQSNYKVTYKKEDKDSRYTTYEFFYG